MKLEEELLDSLKEAVDHLAQYMDYAEEMRKIGRGFYPSSGFSPRYLIELLKATIEKAEKSGVQFDPHKQTCDHCGRLHAYTDRLLCPLCLSLLRRVAEAVAVRRTKKATTEIAPERPTPEVLVSRLLVELRSLTEWVEDNFCGEESGPDLSSAHKAIAEAEGV